MNAAEFVLTGLHQSSNIAVVDPDGNGYSFAELINSTLRVAQHVREQSRPGDYIVVATGNSYFGVCAYLGVILANRIAVPLDPKIKAEDFLAIDEQITISLFIGANSFIATTAAHFNNKPVLHNEGSDSLLPGQSFSSLQDQSDDLSMLASSEDTDFNTRIACLMFTSGSSGKPKGVKVSHRNIIANTEQILSTPQIRQGDRMFLVVPIFHCLGTMLIHTHLRTAATLVLHDNFMFVGQIISRLSEQSCNALLATPSHFQLLLRDETFRQQNIPGLEKLQVSAGGLDSAALSALVNRFPTAELHVNYGQTEATTRVCSARIDQNPALWNSIGKPLPGVEVSLVDNNGRQVLDGEEGELVVTGGSVTCGYLNDESEADGNFRDGALFTGDIGYVDESGFIFLTGRISDFIKCSGERVSLSQIEQILCIAEFVEEAAVIAIKDELLGEAPVAFIVVSNREPPTELMEKHLKALCRKNLKSYLVPKSFYFVAAIPKSAAGKPLKRKLRETLCE